MKYYRCQNNCHITDKNLPRCPRCGGKMRYDGDRTPEEINKKTQDIQNEHRGEQREGKIKNNFRTYT